MTAVRPVSRLTIIVGETDQWGHHPVFTEIVRRAHNAGLAGASVFRGIEGFGASSQVHTSRILSLSGDLPVVILIVDSEEKIQAFLPQLDEVVTGGVVTVEPMQLHQPETTPPGPC